MRHQRSDSFGTDSNFSEIDHKLAQAYQDEQSDIEDDNYFFNDSTDKTE